ncbi:MAG: ABC transporter ATP-binding protein [Alphaproteobacteria bacterium]|nr:ABC transporter ATP-binding protein [Alphaproteobacteria bacterium]
MSAAPKPATHDHAHGPVPAVSARGTAPEALRLEDLTLAYERHPAVHHLSGSFVRGSLTAIVGPNGGGKSTLLKAVMGLIRPAAGRIERFGLDPARIAYLPQAAELDRAVPVSVAELAMLGHWRRLGAFGAASQEDRARAQAALNAVGLAGFERRPIATLSAGQLRRALFARLMLEESPLILLDEPFASIDQRAAEDLMGVIARWHGEGRTVVAVLHELDRVRRHFPATLLLARHKVAWGPTADVLAEVNLTRARALTAAWDEAAEVCAA